MLQINDLLVSQETVDANKVRSMQGFVKNNGIWRKDVFSLDSYCRHGKEGLLSPLIAITRFENGFLLIQNGHHRCRATSEVRSFLYDEEYLISDWSIDDYLEINFNRDYVTPFNPITEVRFEDFLQYKKKVLALAVKDQTAAVTYIKEHSHEYKKTRTIERVSQLCLQKNNRENFKEI